VQEASLGHFLHVDQLVLPQWALAPLADGAVYEPMGPDSCRQLSHMEGADTAATTDGSASASFDVDVDVHSGGSLPINPGTKNTNYLPVRVLSIGLGGGNIHNWLLNFNPYIVVDTVELFNYVGAYAKKYFGLAPLLCRELALLDNGTFVRHSVEEAVLGFNRGSFAGSNPLYAAPCRSTLIIADAWQYLRVVAASSTAEVTDVSTTQNSPTTVITASSSRQSESKMQQLVAAPRRTYDIIIIDVYTSSGSTWNGVIDEGIANLVLSSAVLMQGLQDMRTLLTPVTGIAMFHLTRDSQFMQYASAMVDAFSSEQLVFLRVKTNDYMVLASREKFMSAQDARDSGATVGTKSGMKLLHPCTNRAAFSAWVVQFGRMQGFSERLTYGFQYSLDCKILYDIEQWKISS
jgi:hypothetical protein